METPNVGDHVVIHCNENRFHRQGAIVVSLPFVFETNGVSTQLVTVKVFSKKFEHMEPSKWEEIFMIMKVSDMKPDTENVFEMKRVEVKFGHFWVAYFLKEPLNPDKECCFCQNSVKRRIELNIHGCIHQYDVCQSCAKKWDGVLTDGPPLKKTINVAEATATKT